MSVASELARLKRDVASLEEEIAVNSGPRARVPLSPNDKRSMKAELQGLIQKLDELASRLSS